MNIFEITQKLKIEIIADIMKNKSCRKYIEKLILLELDASDSCGSVYVPGPEIIIAHERVKSIKKILQRQPDARIPGDVYMQILNTTADAVLKSGIINEDTPAKDVIMKTTPVIPIDDAAIKKIHEKIKIMGEINSNKELLKHLQETIDRYTTRRRKHSTTQYSSSRTGKKGKGGGVKDIEKAIAYTAIART